MLTQKQVKKYLDYNPYTGIFKWKIDRYKRIKAGDIAGSLDKEGYILIGIDYKRYKAHRLAWLYVYGEFTKEVIEHINHKKSDNRIENLRSVSQSINCRNRVTDKYDFGVTWHKASKKWRADICVKGIKKSLGIFNDKIDAINSRKKAEREYDFLINMVENT